MNINSHVLKATGRIDSNAEIIESIIHKSIKDITKILPVKNVDIIYYDNPEGAIEHIGIGGYTPNANIIYISLNPSIENFTDKIQNHLGRQIAHELHHTIRWHNPGYGQTLLEALITEGLGDAFSYEIFPGEIEDWDKALSEEQIIACKSLAEKNYSNAEYNHNDWFFGSVSIPKWTGYTLGYNLVAEYLQKNNKKASDLFSTNAKDFIK